MLSAKVVPIPTVAALLSFIEVTPLPTVVSEICIGYPTFRSLILSVELYAVWNYNAIGTPIPVVVVIQVIIPLNPSTNLILVIVSSIIVGFGAITSGASAFL